MKIEITAQDEIVITGLRPMSEAPKDGTNILAYIDKTFVIAHSYRNDDCWWISFNDFYNEKDFIGWTPLPNIWIK